MIHFENWLVWHNGIGDGALNIGFEEIEGDLKKTIGDIGRYLGQEASLDDVRSIYFKYRKDVVYNKYSDLVNARENSVIDCGFSFYERDTLFHRRHVSTLVPKEANELLEISQLEAIKSRFQRFIDQNENYIWRKK